jgi:hypothetical protein
MGMAEYITKRFLGKEICVSLDDDVETITYAEVWTHNKAYFHGIVKSVEEGVLELEIDKVGVAHINCNCIKMAWESSFIWRKAIKVFMTDKAATPSGR